MAQHDYVIDNQTAPNFRSDLNSALLAAASNNSGPSAPSDTYANMLWYDTTNNILKMRNEADDTWINIGTLNQSTNKFEVANLTTLPQSDWETGTSTTEAIVSPAKVKAAIDALVPPTETIEQLNDVFTGTVTTGSTSTTYLGFSGISHFTVAGSFDFTGAARFEYATSVDNGASFSGYTQITSGSSSSGTIHKKFDLPAGTNGLRLQLIRTGSNTTNTVSCLVLGVRT